jgi:hypothetical protein
MYIYIYYLYICFLIFNYMSLYKKSYRNNFLVSITIPAFFSCGNGQIQNSDKGITAENIASKDSATKESFLKSLGVPTEAIDKDGNYKAPENKITVENVLKNQGLIEGCLKKLQVPTDGNGNYKAPEVTLKDIKENTELAKQYLKELEVPTDGNGNYKAPENEITVENVLKNQELIKGCLKELQVPTDENGKYKAPEVDKEKLIDNFIGDKNSHSALAEKISKNPELTKSVLEKSDVPSSFINNGKFKIEDSEFISLLMNAIEKENLRLLNDLIDFSKNREIDIKYEDLPSYMKTSFSDIYMHPNELMPNHRRLNNKIISIKIKDNKKIEISIKDGFQDLQYFCLKSPSGNNNYNKKLFIYIPSKEKEGMDVKLNNFFFSDESLKITISDSNSKVAEILKDHYTINTDGTFKINEFGYKHLNEKVLPFTNCKTFSVEDNSIKIESQIIYNRELQDPAKGPFYSEKF